MIKNIVLASLLIIINTFIGHSQKINTTALPDPSPCPSGFVFLDSDADGYGTGNQICSDGIFDESLTYSSLSGDCNDNNPLITISRFWFQDLDGDGFGNVSTTIKSCTPPIGYVGLNGDCNDNSAAINPNTIWYQNSDNDGFGNPNVFINQCLQPLGYINNNLDCDDTNPALNPNTKWYRDQDNDGFGNINNFLIQCLQPSGYILNNTDCNDTNPILNALVTWYQDLDNDGFGNPIVSSIACSQPLGYVSNNLDNCPTIFGTISGCVVPTPNVVYNNKNYIITTTPKIPVQDIQSISNSKDVVVSITYYDDLGKPQQNIVSKQSATGKNIVTHMEYDSYSRQAKDYLPYKSSNQAIDFENNALTSTLNYPDYTGQNPYSEKLFESSPLSRVLKQGAPGTDWALGNGHEIKIDYLTNIASEVKLYVANATWNTTNKIFDITFSQNGTSNYAANQLFKTITKDENWISGLNNTTEEFKDKEGRVILKRTYDNSIAHDTYYVYDQYSNLTYVIPPLVTNLTAQLDGLCYQYKYDVRNRLVEKKLPGKQWEFIVYDKLDRVVCTGPAFSPFTNITGSGWLNTKYDVFNRPVSTSWISANFSSTTRPSVQNAYNNTVNLSETKNATATDSPAINFVSCRYSNTVIPTSGFHFLTVNYYDDYNFSFAPSTIPATVEGQSVFYNTTVKPKGILTGSWVRVPTTSILYDNEKSYTLFDYKARPIRNYKSNYSLGYIQTDSKLQSLTGRVDYTITNQLKQTGGAVITVKDEYTYSDQDRLLIQTNQINALPKQLIVSNTYDELGKLQSKKVGGTDVTGAIGLQKVDYSYNIRNWLTEINKINTLTVGTDPLDLFAFKISYNTTNDVPGYTGTKLYNGNISETQWQTAYDQPLLSRKYAYKYDALNRLKNAYYQKPGNVNPIPDSYNENLTYDKNGNILTLNRNGTSEAPAPVVPIDNLVYNYDTNSNKLIKVTDNQPFPSGFRDGANLATEYTYDVNGNMITDANKGISTAITYNHLNLPLSVFFPTGNIAYIYNANGEKVKKVVTVTTPSSITTTDYLDGFQFVNNTLQFFPTSEGYVNAVSGFKYVYQYKDHLGNIRVSYSTPNNIVTAADIIEENHYYPFGLKHAGYNTNVTSGFTEGLKYKYNGKELQEELGLNVYDYGARNYDSALGRWMNIDPLAEKSRRFSPFSYALNNPVYFIDPDGMTAERFDGVSYSRGHWSDAIRMQSGALPTIGENDDQEKPKQEEIKGKREKIVNTAKKLKNSKDYGYFKKKDNFKEKTNKCNKFIYDVLKKAGLNPQLPNGNLLGRIIGEKGSSPATAGQWADKNYYIKGWEVVSNPQAGDVVAISADFSDATGHVAIMISETESIGAGEDEVHITDFGFSEDYYSEFPGNDGYVYRRYTGKEMSLGTPTWVNPAYKQYP